MNGPEAASDEGMSYVDTGSGEKITLNAFVDELGPEILGEKCFARYGTWPMYSKFSDYEGPLFHHMHLRFEDAAKVVKPGN